MNFPGNRWYSTLTLWLLCCFFLLPPCRAQTVNLVQNPQVLAFLMAAFEAVFPSNPSNSYFPEFMKEKLRWFFEAADAERLQFEINWRPPDGDDKRIMDSRREDTGILVIGVYLVPLGEMLGIRVSDRSSLHLSREGKNSLVAALTHEVEHLQDSQLRGSFAL